MEYKYYVSLSNGDYNQGEIDLVDTLATVEFEMTAGCQGYVMITTKKLTGKQYSAIQDIMYPKMKQMLKKGGYKLK